MEYNWSGSLDNENSSASVDIVFSNSNRATDGDVYDTTMRIDRSFNYNAGTIHINASGIKVLDINTGKDVQEFSSIGTVSVGGSSKTLDVGGSVSFDINYHMGLNVSIAFNCSLNSSSWEIYAGTITASWSGVSNNCSYSFKSDNSFSYTGSSQTILNSYEAAYLIASGQSAIEVGDYTCTLTVKPQYKATHCLRDTSGQMTDSVSQSWHITKANPKWTISPSTTSLEINKTGSVTIEGEFTGIKNVSQYSSNGGKLNLLGLYKDNVTYMFSGVSAGTVVVTIDAPENNYYYSSNRFFTVIVSKNKEDQHWYYSNKTITVGETVYIDRKGYNISSATPELTIGNSNIISATIDNSNGQLTVIGKATGTSTLTVKIPADENYNEHSSEITITVTGKKEQYWRFDSPINLKTGETITVSPIEGTLYGTVSIGATEEGRKLFKDIKFNTTTQILTIIANDSISGSTIINVVANGNSEYLPWEQEITINITKEDVNWEFNSPISIEQGKSATVTPTRGKITGSVKFGFISGEAELLFNDVSFNNSTQELKIETKSTGSGSTTLTVLEIDPKDITHVLHEQKIIVNVTEEQQWEFVGSVDIELDNTAILKPLTGTLYGKVVFGYPIGDEKYFTNISFNSTKQELTISANATYSGNTTLTIMAQGDATHGYKEQDIIVNIIKHKQAWELRPSEISIPVGGSSTIKIAGDIPLGGILTPTYSSQYIDVVSHTVAGTNPYYTITGKQAVSRTVLTISNTEVPTYDDLSKYAYITVGNKKEQTWETAHGTEITIEPYGNYYISIFGAVYGGIDYSTESSIINISDKSENGCKITSNGTSGTAIVKIYSPGNEEYNEKTINVTITVSKKLQWIPINPHIYKNGKWAEMFPKIYKNGKWLSGTIWKYVSEGDIYGK